MGLPKTKEQSTKRFAGIKSNNTLFSVNKVLTERRKQLGHEWQQYTSGTSGEPTLQMLYSLIRAARPQIVFEYGVCHAFGTGYMAQALKDNEYGHIWGFDLNVLPSAFELLKEAGLRDQVTLVEGDSKEQGSKKAKSLGEEIDFVFIDGDHTTEGMYGDFKSIEKYLAPQALVIFHDIALGGVAKALNKVREEFPDWQYISLYPTAKGLGLLQKPSER